MLTLTQSKSVTATARYFETLSAGDYYIGEQVVAVWHGRTAEKLGLSEGSELAKEQFMALLAGKNPVTGKPLTQRTRRNRRPGMDMTFSVPKSVSLAWAITKDEAVLTAFRESVNATMAEDVEPLMHRRVREGEYSGTRHRTQTGNMLWAGFEHKTARPVGDIVDPQLHQHCFVFNVTEQDGDCYAAELEEIVRCKARLEAGFKARLAANLEKLGYKTIRTRDPKTGRLSFEIAGISRGTIEKFSTRTKQIEDHAAKHSITDARQKAELGKKLRAKKDTATPLETLHVQWERRLTDSERESFRKLRGGSGEKKSESVSPEAAVRFALDHHLENSSTVEEHQLVATALRYSVSQSPKAIEKALAQSDVISRTMEVHGAQHRFVTTREVLEQERFLIAFARDGRGTRKTLCPGQHVYQRDFLNEQQRAVVEHIRNSRDQTIVVTGGAGTGKTATMSEAADAVRDSGREIFACAPSTSATEVLKKGGFPEATTVEHLIRNTSLHDRLRGQVMLVDEAGLLDARSMTSLFRIAEQQNARVILVGDSRQHASPKRGESLTLLEKEAGLNVARLNKIQRQTGSYREAVELVSRGHEMVDRETTGLLAGFDKLDALGKVIELGDADRHAKLAESYITARRKGQSTIVVAPTHAEGKAVSETIREQLRANGTISADETSVLQLRSLHLTNAEKAEALSYQQDNLIVQFHQNAKGGYVRGKRYRVLPAHRGTPQLVPMDDTKARPVPLPASQSERFEVYKADSVGLSVGDAVRFTLGGSGTDRKSRIANGRIDEIKAFRPNGDLLLKSGIVVSRNYGHLTHGFVTTSHGSQGHTRDVAIAAMGSESLPAVNAKQMYVTISRGRRDVVLYVDDKKAVRRAIQRTGQQLSATELVAKAGEPGKVASQTAKATRRQTLARRRQTVRDRVRRWWDRFGVRVRKRLTSAFSVNPVPPSPSLRRS